MCPKIRLRKLYYAYIPRSFMEVTLSLMPACSRYKVFFLPLQELYFIQL
jgi:hypothetical protein